MAVTVDALAREIERVAESLDLTVQEITRDRFLATDPEGFIGVATRGGNWGKAKAIACGDKIPLPAVPTGYHTGKLTTQVGPGGKIERQWIRSHPDEVDPLALAEYLAQTVTGQITPRAEAVPAPARELPRRMAVYPMGDPHLGMLATRRLTGQQDWDLDMAVRYHKAAIDELIEEGPPASEALLINLGDFFHVAGPSNATVKGTPQDVSGFFHEHLEAGRDMKEYLIDRLLEAHDRVTVWNRVGNHDGTAAVSLAMILEGVYRTEPRVTISQNFSAMDTMRFGNVGIAATHGDVIKSSKPVELAMMVAHTIDGFKDLSHRIVLSGHVHHKWKQIVKTQVSVKEHAEVIMETFRTLCPGDHWHSFKYRAGRDMVRILIDPIDGEIARTTAPVTLLHRTADDY